MRIVGGNFKGRHLTAPLGQNTRPTTDRAREAVFNILTHGLSLDFGGITVLDLYAGSGALGFEALSRGAARVLFFDNEPSAVKCIKSNGRKIGQSQFFFTCSGDASHLAARTYRDKAATLAFLDPPYGMQLITPTLITLDKGNWLVDGAVIVVEMDKNEKIEISLPFTFTSERHYGNTRFTFLSYKLR